MAFINLFEKPKIVFLKGMIVVQLKEMNIMKLFYTCFLSLFLVTVCNAQEINWMNMDEALAAQDKNPKKIMMDAYTTWCGPCKMMDKNTFHNKDVVAYVNKNFYAVKFDAEGTEEINYQGFKYTNPNYVEGRKGRNSQHFFANALKINGYPSLVFFDEKSNMISPVMGYRTPEELEIYLKMIATNDYKELKSAEAWKEYQENFEGSFKN